MKNSRAVRQPLARTSHVIAGDVNIYHARLLADQQIPFVLECAARLEIVRLLSSLRLLHETLPMLSSVLQRDASHFKRVPLPQYQPSASVSSDTRDPAQALQRFISTPCDPETDRPLKLFVLRGTGGYNV